MLLLPSCNFYTEKLVRAYGEESNMGNLFADAIKAFDERIDIAIG